VHTRSRSLSRRPPWWGWLLIGLGSAGLAVTLLGLIAGAWLFAGSLPKKTDNATCTQRLGAECEDITPEAIGKTLQMTLPPGTIVEFSLYESFQDWHLETIFVVPADQVTVWEESLSGYDEPTSVGCRKLEDRGTDRRCAEAGSLEEQPYRRYTRVTQDDGSVAVWGEAFTT
jgi:hypothetical protein